MARILLNPWGSLGDLHPFLAVGLALKARGAEVSFATIGDYEQIVRGQGFDFFPVGPHFTPDHELITDAIRRPKTGTERMIGDMLVPGLAASYEEIIDHVAGHDVVVTHPVGLAAMIGAEVCRKPWVATALAPAAFFSRYEPPLMPQRWLLSRFVRLSPVIGGLLRRALKLRSRPWSSEIDRFRLSLGLNAGSSRILIEAHSPYLNLAMFDEAIGRPQADWPRHTIQTGACLYANDRELTAEQRSRLNKFLNLDQPPVIVTLGSSVVHCPGEFFSRCLEALDSLHLRGLFISGKNQVGYETTDERRFMQMDYAPYSHVFGAAKAVVSHGGSGTLSQVLRAGKPMLVVPFAHDQPDNADRIQKLGMGLALPIEKFTVSRAGRFIKRLISEHQFADCATNLLPHLVPDGAGRAANAVINLTM